MKSILILVVVTKLVGTLPAQSVRIAPGSIALPSSQVANVDSAAFWIVNETPSPITIADINAHTPQFSVRDTSFAVPASDSHRVWIRFSSTQNLNYQDVVLIHSAGSEGPWAVPVSGSKVYGDSYDATTQNASGEALKTALRNLVVNHTNRGYNGIRDLMFLSVDPVGGELECVYTGRKIPVTDRTTMQNAPNNFNTEHTWPQSKFDEQEPEKADINHLFPTDATANSQRSNYPFGAVVGTPSWSVGGSKLGMDAGGRAVFEPRDVHKGDLSRAMFYFIIRYQNWEAFWTDAGVNQEATFRVWNAFDPPSAKEQDRNNKVGSTAVQGKRNPFIDHPEFVERISRFDGTATVTMTPRIAVAPESISFPATAIGDTARRTVIIASVGSASLNVASMNTTNAAFRISGPTGSLAQGAYQSYVAEFIPTTAGTVSGSIQIGSNDGTASTTTISVSGTGSTSTGVERSDEQGIDRASVNIFPNPFNPETVISVQLPAVSDVDLRVFDLLGREVAVLVNEELGAGVFQVIWDASQFPSGVYFCRAQVGDRLLSRKLVLQK